MQQSLLQGDIVKTYVIDLFCGAGGTSTAIYESNTNISVIACINHDKNAIISHHANYRNCIHYTEDIRTVGLEPLIAMVKKLRADDPRCKIALWASLECTNFSNAKGGPKDADSRSLAESMFRYLNALDPDFFWVENVEEFKQWGPLDENCNPIKDRKGEDFDKWVRRLNKYYFQKDYYNETLISADYGGRTIRKRLFLQFAKDANDIGVPTQTHSRKGDIGEKWLPVKAVLQLWNYGNSIFTRTKKLVWKTHKNILSGLIKYGPQEGVHFGYTYYGKSGSVDVQTPCPTLTTKDRVALVGVRPIFTSQTFGKRTNADINAPFGTLTTVPKGDVIHVKGSAFTVNPQYSGSTRSIDDPAYTVIARQDKAPLALAQASEHELETELKFINAPGVEHIKYENGKITYSIFSDDDEYFVAIKLFMLKHKLLDVCMRPLEVVEMLQIQGFPKDYILKGTKTEQKKYIGNSVEVKVGVALFKAIDKAIQDNSRPLKMVA